MQLARVFVFVLLASAMLHGFADGSGKRKSSSTNEGVSVAKRVQPGGDGTGGSAGARGRRGGKRVATASSSAGHSNAAAIPGDTATESFTNHAGVDSSRTVKRSKHSGGGSKGSGSSAGTDESGSAVEQKCETDLPVDITIYEAPQFRNGKHCLFAVKKLRRKNTKSTVFSSDSRVGMVFESTEEAAAQVSRDEFAHILLTEVWTPAAPRKRTDKRKTPPTDTDASSTSSNTSNRSSAPPRDLRPRPGRSGGRSGGDGGDDGEGDGGDAKDGDAPARTPSSMVVDEENVDQRCYNGGNSTASSTWTTGSNGRRNHLTFLILRLSDILDLLRTELVKRRPKPVSFRKTGNIAAVDAPTSVGHGRSIQPYRTQVKNRN